MKILFATYGQIPQAGKLPSPFSLLQKELEQRGHQVDVLGHHPDMQRVYLISQTRSGPWTLNLQGQSVPKAPIKERVYDEVFRYYQKYLPHVHPWIRWREIERYTFELILSLFDLGKYDLIHTHDALATRAVWRVKPAIVSVRRTASARSGGGGGSHIPGQSESAVCRLRGVHGCHFLRSGHRSQRMAEKSMAGGVFYTGRAFSRDPSRNGIYPFSSMAPI